MTNRHPHHSSIAVDIDGHLARVTIEAPATKNACTGDMFVALGAAFSQLANSGARVIVLSGAGGNFCAGADLSGLAGGGGGGTGDDAGAATRTPSMVESMRVLSDVVVAIHGCPVPVVARIDGYCVGAGLGLALAADLAWCADDARFSVIYAKRGLSLDFGTSWLLRERVGVNIAKELAYTARMFDGAEAARLGLVNAAVPSADLASTVDEVALTIAAGPPIALSMIKRQLDGAARASLADALEDEALAQSVNVRTRDMREALTAYVERRPPEFHGR